MISPVNTTKEMSSIVLISVAVLRRSAAGREFDSFICVSEMNAKRNELRCEKPSSEVTNRINKNVSFFIDFVKIQKRLLETGSYRLVKC